MIKVSVFIATSLDGYIAREDGSLDWLQGGEEIPGEDFGYQSFFSSIDCIVLGRNTFEVVLSFEKWPYGNKPLCVLSSQEIKIPEQIKKTVFTCGGETKEILARLEKKGFQHVYLDGGKTIQKFLRSGLVDEIIISHIPILIGSGTPLFGQIPADVKLIHQATKSYANGIVQSRYSLKQSPQNQ